MKSIITPITPERPRFTVDMREIPSIYTVEYKNVEKGYHFSLKGNKAIMWLLKYKIGVAFVWALVKLKLVKTVV